MYPTKIGMVTIGITTKGANKTINNRDIVVSNIKQKTSPLLTSFENHSPFSSPTHIPRKKKAKNSGI